MSASGALRAKSGSGDRFADASDRSRISEELSATLFVEAGAGTGKTTALVSRIVRLVATGTAELGAIAAITFTEAAAAELRSRLYRAFADSEDESLRGRAAEVEDATITTIHGFAQRLLAEHPIEAGLPLRFEVLDEVAGAIEFEARFGRFVDELYDDQRIRPVLLAAVAIGIGIEPLRQILIQLEQHLDLPPRALVTLGGSLEEVVASQVAAVLEVGEIATAYTSFCSSSDDLLLRRLVEIREALSNLAAAKDWLDGLRRLAALRPQRVGSIGRKDCWDDVAAVRAAVGAFEEARASALSEIGAIVASTLGARLLEEARSSAERRRVEGRLRFHDLLLLARDLLRGSPTTRRAVRSRYGCVLVDEFQDTDALQLDLVRLIGGEDGDVEPGRLFFVGDPKQSIYSFRGAELALYERTRAELVGDEPLRLVTNFRSLPSILDYVNELFATLFVGVSVEEERRADLVSASDRGARPAVILCGGPDRASDASGRRRRDAEEIADLLALARREQWEVRDGGDTRPFRLSDVAVLVPTRTGLAELEAVLEERALDYRVAHSTLIYASSEVQDLLALLRAVDDPGDDRAVVAALRSTPAGCSDVELAAWRGSGGSWRLGPEAPGGEPGRVGDVLGLLRELSYESRLLNVDECLLAIIARFSVRQLLAARRGRADALRRVAFLVERARAYSLAGGGSIAGFLKLAEREAQEGARGVELLGPDDEDDSLRIMTIHGAKGLEFPFVVVADLGGPRRSARGATVLRGPSSSIELRFGSSSSSAGFDEASRSALELEASEALRLAYVAMTRARDYLVLALAHSTTTSGEPSIAQQIWEASEALSHLWLPAADLLSVSEAAAESVQLQLGFSDLDVPAPKLSSPEDWQRARDELLRHLWRPTTVSPSSLETTAPPPWTSASQLEDPDGPVTVEDETDAWRRARQSGALGRAVHLALQQCALDGTDLGGIARAAARAEGIEEAATRVEDLARGALMSPLLERARSSSGVLREVPFSVPLEEGSLVGIVDLCFVEDGELVVLDYKTDALSEASSPGVLLQRYRPQIAAYAWALERATGMSVREAYLLLLAAPDGPIAVEVDELAQSAQSALASARTVLTSSSTSR